MPDTRDFRRMRTSLLVISQVHFLILVEMFFFLKKNKKKNMPGSFGYCNLFSYRFAQSNRWACVCEDMNCLFLITYKLYRMTSCAALRIVLSGTRRSLAMVLINVPGFASIVFCIQCTNCGIHILSECGEGFLTLRYRRHIPAGDFQLLPYFAHKLPGDIQKNVSLWFVCIAKITACRVITCIS